MLDLRLCGGAIGQNETLTNYLGSNTHCADDVDVKHTLVTVSFFCKESA